MANPREKEKVLEKINNGELKIKGKNNPKKRKPKTIELKPEGAEITEEVQIQTMPVKEIEKPKAAEPSKFSDEQFLAALKTIDHPATSREISDKMGIADPEVGRQMVRSRMAKLAEEGKVKISEAPKGTRAGKVYSIKSI